MKNQSIYQVTILIIIILSTHGCKLFKKEPLELNVNGFNVEAYGENNGSIEIEVSGGKVPYSYQWSNGKASQNIYNLPAGKYTVTVTDSKKRSIVEAIEIKQPKPDCVDFDGNIYKTIDIGNQTWMQENLRATKAPDGKEIKSFIYDNNSANLENHGRLYNWNIAMNDSIKESVQGLCPDGWHIPSYLEWQELFDNYQPNKVGTLMTDTEGEFQCKMSGFKSAHTYHGMDYYTNFWTSTKYGDNAWKVDIYEDLPKVFLYHGKIDNSYSIRCVKNK